MFYALQLIVVVAVFFLVTANTWNTTQMNNKEKIVETKKKIKGENCFIFGFAIWRYRISDDYPNDVVVTTRKKSFHFIYL